MFKRLALAALCLATPTASLATPADYVLTGAKIYTEDAKHSVAEALAVSGGKIVYVGDAAGAKALIGPATQVEQGDGRLVLPGLVDAHIHPTGIADLDVCSLESQNITLDALPAFVQACIARYHIQPGQWVAVQQWNFTGGNDPSIANPTLRAALDHASLVNPVTLVGNDGHHGAFNSLALARAKTPAGQVVGFTRATLRSDFPQFQKVIGVDAAGEPNGTVNEDARGVMGAPDLLSVNFEALMKTPEKVPQRLNSVGITAIQDAAVVPEIIPFYDSLLADGKMTVRVNLMQLYQPEDFKAADGTDKTPDTIAHLQVVSPEDVARIGKDHLYLAYTYSWMTAVPEYDISVVPFFEHVSGNSFAAFHDPKSYYEQQFYPDKATKLAGATLVAGSDAPVNTRDPQPFVNMMVGVTRSYPPFGPATPSQRLDVREVLDAYTINGAHAMGRADEFGSLEVGKSADFILVDRDFIALADAGKPEEIGKTKVLETWFMGRRVYTAAK